MKKDKMLDVFTGIVVGALIGLYHPLGEYQLILVILGVVLGLRYLKVIT